jgi:class 3 adenylate cyclase
MRAKETRYARTDDGLHIAYGVAGDGPIQTLLVSNWLSDVESTLTLPVIGEVLERIASFTRLTWFDQPGSGQSDPVAGDMPTLENFSDSIRVVMDDAKMEQAALLVWDIGTPAAIMFAATHPERVSHLVICGGSARFTADADYAGISTESLAQVVDALVGMWGTTTYALFLAPSMAGDEKASQAVASWARNALSPGMARRIFSMALGLDVRALLPLVAAPTLLLHFASAMASAPVSQAEYMAEHLPNAMLRVFESADHIPHQEDAFEWLVAEMQEFLTGERPTPPVDDRVLATVLFTDFVDSTAKAAALGDARWKTILDDHDALVRRQLERFRGRYINTTGDGVLATFDGPARAVRCAQAICDGVRALGIEVRSGLHTGEVELRGEDIGGIAVHIAARVMARAGAGEVIVSSTVKDLVAGSGIVFADRGTHTLKGVPEEWRLYAVEL